MRRSWHAVQVLREATHWLLCSTDREASNMSIFLKETLDLVTYWRVRALPLLHSSSLLCFYCCHMRFKAVDHLESFHREDHEWELGGAG